MTAQQLTCPSCGETIPAENINIGRMKAVCPACHAAFSINRTGQPNSAPNRISCPAYVKLERSDDGMEIRYRSSHMSRTQIRELVPIIVLCMVIAGLISHYSFGANQQTTFIVAVGVLIILLAQKTLNHVVISINQDQVTHREAPIPMLNTIQEATPSVAEFQAVPINRHRVGEIADFSLLMQFSDGTRYALRKKMQRQTALFIAQELQTELEYMRVEPEDDTQDYFFDDEISDGDVHIAQPLEE